MCVYVYINMCVYEWMHGPKISTQCSWQADVSHWGGWGPIRGQERLHTAWSAPGARRANGLRQERSPIRARQVSAEDPPALLSDFVIT